MKECVKGIYVRTTQKRLLTDEEGTELGQMKEENNMKVKRDNEGAVLLLRLTSILQSV